MTRSEKSEIIAKLEAEFKENEAIIVCDYRGLNVKKLEVLRNAAREQNVKVQIVKNTLANIALKNADKNGMAWKATKAAVSVGSIADGQTRQITGLAAGTQDTDAVNVAQLKAAGFKFKTTDSTGQASGSSEEKVKNGDLFVLDAGKNIALTQSGKTAD